MLFVVIQINYLNENNYMSASVSLRFSPASNVCFFFLSFFFFFILSALNRVFRSVLSCPAGGEAFISWFLGTASQNTQNLRVLISGWQQEVSQALPHSGHDWFLRGRPSRGRLNRLVRFDFAPDVRLFDIFVFRMRPLCICPVICGYLGSVNAEKMAEGTGTTQQLLNDLPFGDL